jgi:P4 family phage/plasmid primase-like protien
MKIKPEERKDLFKQLLKEAKANPFPKGVPSYFSDLQLPVNLGLAHELFEDALMSGDPMMKHMPLLYRVDKEGFLPSNWSRLKSGRFQTSKHNSQGLSKGLRQIVSLPGRSMMLADISSSHPRLIACRHQNEFTQIYEEGKDPYNVMCDCFGISDRSLMKQVFNAKINGQSNQKSSNELKELQPLLSTDFSLMDEMKTHFPKVLELIEEVKANSVITSKYWDEIIPLNDKGEVAHYKMGGYMFQAIEAECLRRMMYVWDKATKMDDQILPTAHLTIHDAILSSTTQEMITTHKEAVIQLMMMCLPFNEKLSEGAIKVTYGPSWGEQNNSHQLGVIRPVTRVDYVKEGRSYLDNRPKRKPTGGEAIGLCYMSDSTQFPFMLRSSSLTRDTQQEVMKMTKVYQKSLSGHQEQVELDKYPVLGARGNVSLANYVLEHMTVEGIAPMQQKGFGIRQFDSETTSYKLLSDEDIQYTIQEEVNEQRFCISGKVSTPYALNKSASIAEELGIRTCKAKFSTDATIGTAAFLNTNVTVDSLGIHTSTRSTEDLVPHEHLLTVKYDESAECPMFMEFIESLFRGDDDANEKIAVIQEYLGNALLGTTTKYDKHLFFLGPRASNGKSTFLDVFASLFDESVVTSVQPVNWVEQEFMLQSMSHASINIVNDILYSYLSNSGTIKSVLSGEKLTVNKKNKDPITMRFTASHFFCGNKIPLADDETGGLPRRLIFIQFENKFTANPEEVNEAERTYLVKYNIYDDLIKTELPGIANWAIKGALRFHQNNKYTSVPSSDLINEEWLYRCSSTLEFVSTVIKPSNEKVYLSVVKDRYNTWCQENGNMRRKTSNLVDLLKTNGFNIHRDPHGSQKYIFASFVETTEEYRAYEKRKQEQNSYFAPLFRH